MRLRRLELVVLGLTLAFACFVGGYFTGRNVSAVNVVSFGSQQNETQQTPESTIPSAKEMAEAPETDRVEPSSGNGGQPQESVGSPRDTDGRININLASRSELMDLPGIGSVLSERIVDYRRANGQFSSVDELKNVSGIGEKRFETIKDKVTVGS